MHTDNLDSLEKHWQKHTAEFKPGNVVLIWIGCLLVSMIVLGFTLDARLLPAFLLSDTLFALYGGAVFAMMKLSRRPRGKTNHNIERVLNVVFWGYHALIFLYLSIMSFYFVHFLSRPISVYLTRSIELLYAMSATVGIVLCPWFIRRSITSKTHDNWGRDPEKFGRAMRWTSIILAVLFATAITVEVVTGHKGILIMVAFGMAGLIMLPVSIWVFLLVLALTYAFLFKKQPSG